MSLRYSPSTGGFYDTTVHLAIPDDAVYVSPTRHQELLAAQAEGSTVAPAPDTGNPVIAPPIAHDSNALKQRVKLAVLTECERRCARVMPLSRQVAALRGHLLHGASIDQQTLDAFAAIDAIEEAAAEINAAVETCSASALQSYPVRRNTRWPEGD